MQYAPMSCWSGFTRESAPKAASGELSRGKAHHVDRLGGRCAGGAPIHTVSQILGHSSIVITGDITGTSRRMGRARHLTS
jgi:hypothetical protein